MAYRTQLPGPLGGRDLRLVFCTGFQSSHGDRACAALTGKLLDSTLFFFFFLASFLFLSLLHSPPGVSWDHPPDKPLTLHSLLQRLLLVESELKQVR